MPTIRVGPGSGLYLQQIADTMGKSRKVVVITGAGISTNCGIPDFRSEDGLYSLIQAQYDAALKNPPWEKSNTFDIDDRPKKKRKSWYYEVVAPDGQVVDVIDEEAQPSQSSQESQPQQAEPRRSSRSDSANTTTSNSRSSTPKSSDSSLTSLSSTTPERPDSFAEEKSIDLSSSSPDSSSTPATASQKSTSTVTCIPLTSFSSDASQSSTNTSKSCSLNPTSSQARSSQQTESTSRSSLPNLKGRDLFDCMVWTDPFTTSIFYMFISSLRERVLRVSDTTPSHKFLRVLRDGGRLVRNYTQNIDMLEAREGLCTRLSEGPGSRGRFNPKIKKEARESGDNLHGGCESVQLHGSLDRLRCGLCGKSASWDDEQTSSATIAGMAPDCSECTSYSRDRTGKGRRSLAIGRLRPDIVLYGEEHPHANLIGPLVTHDLALSPDVLLIMGTSLKVHGLKIIVKEFAKSIHSRGGKVVFINRTKPPESAWTDVIDYWVEWDCDAWVMDLKTRREDIWLPEGSTMPEDSRRESAADGKNIPKKPKWRPQATRDDKLNGVYVTFKILDTLRSVEDADGNTAIRYPYWPPNGRASNVSIVGTEEPQKTISKKKTTKAPRVSATKPKPESTNLTSKGAKRKAVEVDIPDPHDTRKFLPDRELNTEDTKKTAFTAYFVAEHWEALRKLAPNLPGPPPQLQLPFNRVPEKLPTWWKSSGDSNHFANIGAKQDNDDWVSKINLLSHPPSGASVPIHTPKREERRPNNHGYGTRASRRFNTSDTIVVDGGETSEGRTERAADDTIVVDNLPATPESQRIKRISSIGNIVSSPETVWHDAPETLEKD